ncbi:MAG: CHASE2 domain-containing protein [Cyanobacteria bacterium J06554_3]
MTKVGQISRYIKRLNQLLPGLMTSLIVVVLLLLQTWLPLERMVSNQIMRWRGTYSWDSRLVMVSIDDKTLEQFGQYPISRDYYARLLNKLKTEDASVVVFNLILSDSVTSNRFSSEPISKQTDSVERSANERFARAMAIHGRVIVGQVWDVEGNPVEPIPVFSDTALAKGHMRLSADRDGFARSLEVTYGNLPALGIAAIQAYSLEDELVSIPSDLSRMHINWPGPVQNVPTISLADVINGESPPDAFTGKIILVGYGATSGFAPMRTAFNNRWPVPGSYMHAAVIDNVLNQNWLKVLSPKTVAMGLLLLGPCFSWLLYRRNMGVQLLLGVALSGGWILSCVLALKAGYLLPVVSPLVVLSVTTASVIVWGRLQSNAMLQVRSAFLSTMSHEIRTPLNAIMNLSEMLQETPLDERQREYAETLTSSSQTLMALINDVLDFSKIESGRLALEDYPVTLVETVERSLELLATKAAEKDLELVYAIAPTVPSAIIGDPVRLQQILANLLSNAVKFTDAGEVTVRVKARPYRRRPRGLLLAPWRHRRLRHKALPPSNLPPAKGELYEIQIEVSDTGIGIPADRMSQLFKPFSQASASIARQYGGTGLGLSISKRLSERMGGSIWAKSILGRGSTFFFTFQAQESYQAPALPDYVQALKGASVLVIDRNQTRLEQISRELQTLGIQFVQATSLSEAIVFIHNAPMFDGVILDEAIASTSSDISTAVSTLRQAIANERLPILLLSALRRDARPCASHITMLWKPVKQVSLYQALRSIRPQTLAKPTSAVSALSTATETKALSSASSPNSTLTQTRPANLDILIAEDNRINQTVALRLLELLGYGADVVNSGAEALEAIQKRHYDVILMDMRMPDLDGLEATRQIRQLPEHNNIWIIAMTANGMASDRKRCFDAGMNDYLRKPVKREALAQALQRCPVTHQRLSVG